MGVLLFVAWRIRMAREGRTWTLICRVSLTYDILRASDNQKGRKSTMKAFLLIQILEMRLKYTCILHFYKAVRMALEWLAMPV